MAPEGIQSTIERRQGDRTMLQAGHIASELRKERVNWQWSGWAIASDLTSGETLPPKSSTAFPLWSWPRIFQASTSIKEPSWRELKEVGNVEVVLDLG